MAQNFDTEVAAKLQPIIDLGNDDVMPKLKQGAESTIELAKEIGSASLERTSTALYESSDAMVKLFGELFECAEKYIEYNKRLESALG